MVKSVIIFGGTGWLGHTVAVQLAAAGADVTIASRGKKNTFTDRVDHFDTVTIDKNDAEAMKELFACRQWDAVIDTVPTLKSIESIANYARGMEHYVHCSSTGGYAPLPFVPCDETAPYIGFDNSSGWRHKAIVDSDVMMRFNTVGFPATVIRPCYITGPGMLPLDNLGGRRREFIPDIINGVELPLPDDGQALLQPIHIEDLAASFVLALTHPHSKGQIYNITLDHAIPLNRYINLNAEALGCTAKIRHTPLAQLLEEYPQDPIGMRFLATHMCFTNAKARRELDYVPRHTPEEAIRQTARWSREILGL